MFSLQPPRHISTLPLTTWARKRRPVVKGHTGNRGFSLDNLVGAGKQRRRHVETKRPRLITRFVSLTIWLSSVVCRESGPRGRFACV
jgi:hypothetical protein